MKMTPGSYSPPRVTVTVTVTVTGEAHLNQLPLFSHGSPLSLSQLGMYTVEGILMIPGMFPYFVFTHNALLSRLLSQLAGRWLPRLSL